MQLQLQQISKRYRNGHQALSGIDLQLGAGVVGLLGPNGAGKSSLMNILATLNKPSSGEVLLNGIDIVKQPEAMRARLGYLPQDFGVYPNLSAREFLHYLAAVKGLDRHSARQRIDGLLELTNLSHAAERALGGYSGGMRQRVGIAQALLNDPQVLIFDEPTVGLDPEERLRFRQLIAELSGDRIVILSTHIVSDLEATASEIVLIEQGRLLGQFTAEQLIAAADGKVWDVQLPAAEAEALRAAHPVVSTLRRGSDLVLRVLAEQRPHDRAEARTASLEDAYLYAKRQAKS